MPMQPVDPRQARELVVAQKPRVSINLPSQDQAPVESPWNQIAIPLIKAGR